jgi:hypothetical protein
MLILGLTIAATAVESGRPDEVAGELRLGHLIDGREAANPSR